MVLAGLLILSRKVNELFNHQDQLVSYRVDWKLAYIIKGAPLDGVIGWLDEDDRILR